MFPIPPPSSEPPELDMDAIEAEARAILPYRKRFVLAEAGHPDLLEIASRRALSWAEHMGAIVDTSPDLNAIGAAMTEQAAPAAFVMKVVDLETNPRVLLVCEIVGTATEFVLGRVQRSNWARDSGVPSPGE